MSREAMLARVRAALGRSAGQAREELPPPRIEVPDVPVEARIESLFCRLEKLGGKGYVAQSPADACQYVARLTGGQPAVASNTPFLKECGITDLPSVRGGIFYRQDLKAACAAAAFGISSADWALADTGSLVMIASPDEARLISLLPPVHIAVIERGKILTGLDELYSKVPRPAEVSSSMVLITGPSRTADIEQILVRGVHGPGEVYVIVV